MYEILGLIYIGQVAQNLRDFFAVFGTVMLVVGGFFYVFFRVEKSEEKKLIKQMKIFIISGIIAMFAAVLMPSKGLIYAIAGVKASKLAGEKNEIVSKAIKLIKKKIDEELKE